ncbi:MAG: protein translocase subunit SecF [Chloroflexi bacterium]|nr:protein translocase subunit SecF [Chloroflexota bacterium]
MTDIVGKRYWYFLISAMIIIPGLIAMGISTARFGSPLRLSIDFTGGALMELVFEQPVAPGEVRQVFVDRGYGDTMVQTTQDEMTVLIRSKELQDGEKAEIQEELKGKFGPLTELRFDQVGPTVGREVTRSAAIAITAAALVITGFIVFAWRKVPNALRYGLCATAATLHDVLVTAGMFSILGLLLGWEADSLFLTAMLTVTGYSVQDTIVVFDRIRENVPKRRGEPYELIVNRSLLETIHRSLATQLNAIFVLVAILFFGGATIRQFVATLVIGLLSGTYSSVFTAVPLLVVWEKGELGGFFRRLFGRSRAAA